MIVFQNVSKKYRRNMARGSLRDSLANLIARGLRRDPVAPPGASEFWALRDVSFEVRQGEVLGLVGANGAGKSTILKLLSKVTIPTSGQISVNGRVSALIELGAGFHPDLTGRENIYLNGAILGLTRRQIAERFESIVEFSELAEFIDTPVKWYSSGMYVRLGFAVAVHVDPEVMLVDEVLAVGDVRFRDKCMKKIDEFRRQGKTMVVVSHDRHMLERLCTRALLIDHGQLRAEGAVEEVMDRYFQDSYRADPILASIKGTEQGNVKRHYTRPIEITGVSVTDASGQQRPVFISGESVVVRIAFRANSFVSDPVFLCDILRDDQLMNGNNTSRFDLATGQFQPGDTGVVEVCYEELNLLAGQYYVHVGITQDIFTQIKYHVVDKAAVFDVTSTIQQGIGFLQLPQRWTIHRNTPQAERDGAGEGAVEMVQR
ncbi:MAG TPA: ABC transporter ATP-binding protein [Chloroflexota bacterium]|nr:ABC transporter ATP-binding protein [Chloroflexota bacterium]